jgi:hypothetical protein
MVPPQWRRDKMMVAWILRQPNASKRQSRSASEDKVLSQTGRIAGTGKIGLASLHRVDSSRRAVIAARAEVLPEPALRNCPSLSHGGGSIPALQVLCCASCSTLP